MKCAKCSKLIRDGEGRYRAGLDDICVPCSDGPGVVRAFRELALEGIFMVEVRNVWEK